MTRFTKQFQNHKDSTKNNTQFSENSEKTPNFGSKNHKYSNYQSTNQKQPLISIETIKWPELYDQDTACFTRMPK